MSARVNICMSMTWAAIKAATNSEGDNPEVILGGVNDNQVLADRN